jgi:hypothetical protein
MRVPLLSIALAALSCSAADPKTPNDGVGETEGNTEVVKRGDSVTCRKFSWRQGPIGPAGLRYDVELD